MADQQINLVDHTDGENTPQRQTEQQAPAAESHIDILYENQRGWFVFGIPLFSSRALWNLRIDPVPWQDGTLRPSPVNITNAQVPDPSWAWDWKSWYVDMSLDVDEEGWQYSLLFKGSAWHGNHPWFHSFVRRRRWLRRRIKRKIPPKTKQGVRERLFGEAFSIGPTLTRTNTTGFASPQDSSQATSVDDEIRDVVTLMRRLKTAAIDREKILIIHKFMDEGGDELNYLADYIPSIMSLLIFQNSRRQLLSTMMDRFDDSNPYLLKSIEAADAECKKLEYWSDVRTLAHEGTAGNATDPKSGWDEKWEGLDESGAKHPEAGGKADDMRV